MCMSSRLVDDIEEISLSTLQSYVNASLDLGVDLHQNTLTYKEAVDAVNEGLKCAHNHRPGE